MDRITRREFLGGATAISAIAVSGCVAEPEDVSGGSPDPTDGEPTPGDGDDRNTDPGSDGGTTGPGSDGGTTDPGDGNSRDDTSAGSITDAAGIDSASIETVEARCGSPDEDRITVEKNAETVVIDGILPAANPCHKAVLDAGSIDNGTLSVVIDVADTTADGEGCVMCHGVVSYRAEIELGDAPAVESVAVDHETGDRHTADLDGADTDTETPIESGSKALIESASIETTDASCGSGDGEEIAVDFGDEAITVTGTLPAPDPCHEAVLASVGLDDNQLSVIVDVRSTRGDGGMCVQCVGAVTYTARIVPRDPGTIESVAVDHATGTESTIPR
ncbi:MAG: hypothetical protein ABEH88_08115 [Halobacteriales archaeon]